MELDWVIVSIEGLRRWGLVAFLAVLALGAVGAGWYFLHEPVAKRAERTLQHASAIREEVRRAGTTEGLNTEFDQASRLLEEAHRDWDRKDYPACLARAEDSLRRFELLSGLANREFTGAGQLIAAQGKVEIQRANQSVWERAHEKQALYNGDFVKTSSGASAEVLFSDSTVYRIGPDSLLEVHREARSGRAGSTGEVKIKVGQVNVYTALNPSSVLTDSARADVERDSRVGVEVADDSTTTVAAYTGRAAVTGHDGQRVDLSSLQAVRAAPGGALGPRRTVPERPVLEVPPANATINLDQGNRVDLRWRQAAGAVSFELQVSQSRVFAPANLEFETSRRSTNTAVLKISRKGTYYWRVASLGADNVRSEWSDPRAFKAYAGARVEVLADSTAPPLDVAKPTQMGNLIIVQGSTEPGATVTINGETVEVGGDGSFRKTLALNREGLNTIVIRATDPAGNTTEDRKQVFVEVD
jgi:hypothetical protein